MSKTQYYYVTFDLMIGDADNFIHGINIIEKEKWDQEIQEFRNIFGIDTTHEYEFTDCIEYIGDYMWNEQQRVGILECNGLPFIDLHHYPFEGKPQNVAGALWDIVFPDSSPEKK